jgi:hypothetical protein
MPELSPLSKVERKLDFGAVRSPFDPACVKTHLGEGCAELFSQLPSSERSCQHIDEIEMEVLHASWASEFSHSLDPKRTVFSIRARNRACRSLFALARRARSGYFCK